MIDVSDEATGLPPLEEITPEASLLALAWEIGHEGLVSVEGQTMAVRYLSLRGVQFDEDGSGEYAQLHVAMPVDGLVDLLKMWLEQLDGE